jgi:hypothetical protein
VRARQGSRSRIGIAILVVAAAVGAGILALPANAPAGLNGTNSTYKVPLRAIPDGHGARKLRLGYGAITGTVDDANAFVRIKHRRTSDLIVKLEHAGHTAVLTKHDTSGRNLGSGRCKKHPQASTDFPDFATFNDESGTAIADGSAPYDDTNGFRPRDALTRFDGDDLGGAWTLTVKDTKEGAAGILLCARLRVSH